MRRITAAALCLAWLWILLPFTGFASTARTVTVPTVTVATITVLVYMNGSNLETDGGAASASISQMLAAASSPQVRVLIQTGGTRAWRNEAVHSDRNQRFELAQQGLRLVWEGPADSMGDPATLSDFIAWGVQAAPADRYLLIFWGHGHGPVGGFGLDALHADEGLGLYAGDTLTLAELGQALDEACQKSLARFDLIGFDSCLLGCLELAQICAPYADCLVASESLAPGTGWDYTALLNELGRSPDIASEALGRVIVDSYSEQCADTGLDSFSTLSVIRLSRIESVTRALDALAGAVQRRLDDNPEEFYAFAESAFHTTFFGGATAIEGYSDLVDLSDLATGLSDPYPMEAEALRRSVAKAVAYQAVGWEYLDAGGMSVYLPLRDRAFLLPGMLAYDQTSASQAYKLFVSALALAVLQGAWQADQPALQYDNPTFFTSTPRLDTQTGLLHVTLDPDLLPRLDQLTPVLAAPYQQDRLLLLGQLRGLSLDTTNGQVFARFNGRWPALDGHFVMPEILDESDAATRYTFPMLVDEGLFSLHAVYHLNTGHYELLGVRAGLSTRAPERGLTPLEPGQTITPLFRMHDPQTGTEELVEGQSFILQPGFSLSDVELLDGEYSLVFVARDLFQTLRLSDVLPWSRESGPERVNK